MKQNLKSVGIVSGGIQRNFLTQFARLLKEKHGCQIHLYCNGPTQKRFFENSGGSELFDTITFKEYGIGETELPTFDSTRVFAEARNWETQLGHTYNELTMVERHLGRGYALGGYNHPRSRISENTTYVQLVHLYNRRISFWNDEHSEKGIDLWINGTRDLVAVAVSRGVPLRRLIRSRSGNLYYWAFNDKLQNPYIERRFYELADDSITEEGELENARSYVVGRNEFLHRHGGMHQMVRNLARRVALHTYWHWTGSEKAKEYYLSEELRYEYRTWRELRRLLKGRLARLSDLKDQRFVYFPLQTEPEFSLNWQSPEYFFQLPTVAQICRDLPAGVPLVVKETYFAIGRRPSDFYEQIKDFKNVVFMDIREPGNEVVKQAAVTVTLTGSSGHEAAVLGKPVISFGRHNPYNILPHVKVVHDGTELRGHLNDFLLGEFDSKRAVIDGRRFLQAVKEFSFDMLDFNYIAAGKAPPEALVAAHDALLTSLGLNGAEQD